MGILKKTGFLQKVQVNRGCFYTRRGCGFLFVGMIGWRPWLCRVILLLGVSDMMLALSKNKE